MTSGFNNYSIHGKTSIIEVAKKQVSNNLRTMQSLLRVLFIFVALPHLLSSCATRVFCDSEAPRIPRDRSRLSNGTSDEQRPEAYTRGHQGNDGFKLDRVEAIRHQPNCGMDFLASFYTLGIIPHSAPQPIHVIVSETRNGHIRKRTYFLGLNRWTSIWHFLLPPSHDDRSIARALLQAIDNDQQVSDLWRPRLKKYHTLNATQRSVALVAQHRHL